MLTVDKTNSFEKSKIYEKLAISPEPEGYNKNIPWVVQQQIAATNGMHYIDRLGKLNSYPLYKLPVPQVASGIMLDIGNGWGRWLVAGANKGYIPIGIDIRLEFCEAALRTLKDHNRSGYSVVADLKELPFKTDAFDLVWSFSVLQHTHKKRLLSCLSHIHRILKPGGFTYLEFPNKNGIRNKKIWVNESAPTADDYDSWCVRYYTIKEYREIFNKVLGNFKYFNHSFIGIGVLPEDLKYVSLKNKLLVGISLLGSFATKIFPSLKKISDSLYLKAVKNSGGPVNSENDFVKDFLNAHRLNPSDNLNIVHLLRCPASGGRLTLSDDKQKLVSAQANITYPVINNIPVMLPGESSPL